MSTPDHNVTRDNQQQPSGDGQRTPEITDAIAAVAKKWIEGGFVRLIPNQNFSKTQAQVKIICEIEEAIKPLLAERNALRARVAEIERNTSLAAYIAVAQERDAATDRADALQRECEKLNKWHAEERKAMLYHKARAERLGQEKYEQTKVAEQFRAKIKTLERTCTRHDLDLEKLFTESNAAMDAKEADLTTARDELAKWREAAERLAEALAQLKSDHQCTIDQYGKNGPQFTSKTGAEYYEAAYVIGGAEECIGKIDTALTAYRALSSEGSNK